MRLLVGYPPGGVTDALARLVGQQFSAALGQPVIVENQAGAMGAIAAKTVMRAAPDGQTLLLCTNQSHAMNAILVKDLGYDPLRDFTSIAGLADIQQALVVRNDFPARDLRELIAYARANPGKLNYASTGNGSGAHVAMELFKLRTGTFMVHIPYRGGAQMTQDILAGRIDATFATVPSVLGQIQGKRLKALAIASANKSPQLPDVPLLREQGVQGCEADSWLGLVGPAGMPAELTNRYAQIMSDAFRTPAVRDAAVNAGMVVNIRPTNAFATFIASDIKRWSEVVRAGNIKLDV